MSVPFLDKDLLRQELPIAFVCERLGIQLNEQHEAICIWHDDHAPSFRIWTDDRGVEKFGCFPCGVQGDVYDLLRRAEGLSFTDSLLRAEELRDELPEGYASMVTRAAKVEFEQEACERFVADGLARAAGPEAEGWMCVVLGLVDERRDIDYRRQVDRYVRERWRWGLDHAGNTIMPHYDALGRLTGAKVRAFDGRRWSFPGSAFPALYGAWVQRRTRFVLLTEGESDAAFATIQNPPVDVLGLPAGAGKFRDEWAQLEADIYFLAFDADDAGVSATRTWLEALNGRDVRVCRLPRAHDLRSARPAILDLLQHAQRPSLTNGQVLVANGRFERITTQQPKPLCSWYLEPVARLEAMDETVMPALEVNVVRNEQPSSDVITLADLHSASKLRTWAATRALDCTASDPDVQQMASYLLARSSVLPEVFQTSRVGVHSAPAQYKYAGSTVVTPTGSLGRLPWRYVGSGEAQGHVHLEDDGPYDWSWITAFLALTDRSITSPLLAWLVAATRRNEVEQFPLLFLGGSSGSGKTTTARLATQLFGSTLSASLASITQFALIRMLALTTTIPVFVDEWSLQSREDARGAIQSVVTSIYEGGVTTRGRADLSVVEFKLSSPILIAGEDSFHLDREAERMVALRMRHNSQNYDALKALVGQPLHRFARWYYDWLVTADNLPPMPSTALTRPEYNRAVLDAGWQTLHQFAHYVADRDAQVIPDLGELDLTQLESADEDRENEYEAFVMEGLALRDAEGLPLVWPDVQGRGTFIRFRPLTSWVNMNRVDVELAGRSRAMRSYFADRYVLTDERVKAPFSDRPIRATLVAGLHVAPELESSEMETPVE